MRADRLITTLLLLQSRGRLTAGQLAEELEVSVRTVMRDLEALGNAGVPIYSIRGPSGGYEVWDGFRSQLTGLTADEAAALAVLGAPHAATALGLGEARQRVELKLRQSLPPHLRGEIDDLRSWFYDDEGDVSHLDETLTFLRTAIARRRVITARTSTRSGNSKTLFPLGLVRRAGSWHLVAFRNKEPEAFRVRDLSRLGTTGGRFDRPATFDLQAFWHSQAQPTRSSRSGR